MDLEVASQSAYNIAGSAVDPFADMASSFREIGLDVDAALKHGSLNTSISRQDLSRAAAREYTSPLTPSLAA